MILKLPPTGVDPGPDGLATEHDATFAAAIELGRRWGKRAAYNELWPDEMPGYDEDPLVRAEADAKVKVLAPRAGQVLLERLARVCVHAAQSAFAMGAP